MPCPKESGQSIKNPLKAGFDVFPKIALKAVDIVVAVAVVVVDVVVAVAVVVVVAVVIVVVVVVIVVQRCSESQDGANDAKAKPGME